jgi:hypothetical protein
MTAGQKAAHTKKWRRAAQRAYQSGRRAKTFTKYALAKRGYKVLSLDSRSGYEYKGVVDLIAIRRNKKDPDQLEVILLQVKGGTARVSADEIVRLRQAARRLRVDWNVAEKPLRTVRFRKSLG